MDDHEPADDLALRLARGVGALRAGRCEDAIADLSAVAVALEAVPDMADIRARACSLWAQALLDAGRPREADGPCREALGLLRRLRDREGMEQVRGLQDRVVKAIAALGEDEERQREERRVADTPIAELLASAPTAGERAAAYVRKAQAMLAGGREDEAMDLAAAGLDVARAHGDVVWEVFARLVLARLDADLAARHLSMAHERAASCGEWNLVSTIAQTAEALGAPLPMEPGPHLGRREVR